MRKTHAEVRDWRKRVVTDGVGANIADRTKNLGTIAAVLPKDPIERLTRELRHQSIWDQLATLDEYQLRDVYMKGNEEVRAAMREAPQRISVNKDGAAIIKPPMVPTDIIEERALEALRERFPVESEKIVELTVLRDAYDSFATLVSAELKKDAPITLEPPKIKVS